MYDYSGLELLISKEYDDLLAEIYDGCPVIIWGAGHFGRALLRWFQVYPPPPPPRKVLLCGTQT